MNKKKILIFTSRGGGGHLSATDALTQYLGNDYDVSSSLIFADVLKSLDWIQTITFGKYTGEDFYNYCMKRKWFAVLNTLYKAGRNHFRIFHGSAKKQIKQFLLKHKPDLVISVVPIANGPLLDAAQELSIPFLVIPTDLDITTFVIGLNETNYDKFLFTIPFEYAGTRKTVAPTSIDENKIRITGFPIRTSFLEQKDKALLKKKWQLPPDKPIIMVVMGAVGSAEGYVIAPHLARIATPAHIVFCIGKNETLRSKIASVEFPHYISHTIVGFTHEIAELMQCSDMIITKSGSVTVCEALYSTLPLLLDATSTVLAWERLNHTLVQDLQLGKIIKEHADIPSIVTSLLSNPSQLAHYKKNLANFERKNPQEEITKIVKEMIG